MSLYITQLSCLFSASNIIEQAQQLASKFRNTQAVPLDVHSESNLNQLVAGHELIIRYRVYACA